MLSDQDVRFEDRIRGVEPVTVLDDEGVQDVAVVFRDGPRGGSRPDSSGIIVANGPFTAAPQMIGLTPIAGASRMASRTPDRDKIGSMDTYGFDGQSTTSSAAFNASIASGARVRGAVVLDCGDRKRRSGADEPLLKLERFATLRDDSGRSRSIAHREQSPRNAEGSTQRLRHVREAYTASKARRSREVRDQVSVAQLEPALVASALRFAEGLERVALDSPAAVLRRESGEGVHDGVEVGADVQTPVPKVVAGVDDDREGAFRQNCVEPLDEPGAANAAGERYDCARTIEVHA